MFPNTSNVFNKHLYYQGTFRLVNWIPVPVGAGIALYFLLSFEPAFNQLFFVCLFVWTVVILLWRRGHSPFVWGLALIASLVISGVTLAGYRTLVMSAPKLLYEIGPRFFEGEVVAIEPASPGQRYLLTSLDNKGFAKQPIPTFIRVRSNLIQEEVELGSRIRFLAVLAPPSGPSSPEGFDFGRLAFFKQIGAVGYIWGRVDVIAAPVERAEHQYRAFWNVARLQVTRRIEGELEGVGEDLAITFMTGQKTGISKKDQENIRKSGLAHLLAISGLHMGLVAGLVFFSVRFLLTCWPFIALRYPIKKIAALVTLVACYGYLELVGSPLSAQRAFVMVAITLLAVLLDRQAISMRTVSVAALVLLIITPEVLVSVSFQLSFAAVIALVAVFEYRNRNGFENKRARRHNASGRLLDYLAMTVLCSLTATLATAPFIAYHFHSVPLLGIVANMIAVPLTAMIVMPLVLLSYLLMPLGMEQLALVPLGWAFEFLIMVGEMVASIPDGELMVPAFPGWYLAFFIFGGLWLCLFKGAFRYWGGGSIVVFIGLVLFTGTKPDILVDGESGLIAIRQGEKLYLNHPRRARFVSGGWQKETASVRVLDWRELSPDTFLCDAWACRLDLGNKKVALIHSSEAFEEDCSNADYIITQLRVPKWCGGKDRIVIGYDQLKKQGAHSLFLAGEDVQVRYSKKQDVFRPWM
ncbi:ComEC/Rec2 family competence protein [Kiloniella laminariae]|uniref:ComEC/Rec2 family competence protein n=1 Tax=Kiloniella laminariae TaxID=454162 RepID=A0ABT4LLP3_9PROT|nr:ComEC/Rec2 family competence protein [Kiloniella laminariae]MCZ4282040.1 ComEC/Rec2 family competence protein [Kiloniella laminariae]